MSVDIYIKDNPDAGIVSFDSDDGLYWFVYPYLEAVEKETGRMIDLYGYAVFEYELLLELFLHLENAVAKIKQQPKKWKQKIGQDGKTGEDIFVEVDRDKSIEKIEKIMSLANIAYNDGQSLECLGD